MPTATGRGETIVDCKDLDGLRGIASLWIMIFHFFVYASPLIDFQGATLMPLFFLLSGFSLAIGYSGKLPACPSPSSSSSSSSSFLSFTRSSSIAFSPLPSQLHHEIIFKGCIDYDEEFHSEGEEVTEKEEEERGEEVGSELDSEIRNPLIPSSCSPVPLITTATAPSSPIPQKLPQQDANDDVGDIEMGKEGKEGHGPEGKMGFVSLKKFYFNRFIRILPVYYISLIFAIPLTYAGYTNINPSHSSPSSSSFLIGSYIQSFLPTTTWTAFLFGAPFNEPGWTIATLLYFYCQFPSLLPYYERQSDENLLKVIYWSFWCQVGLGLVLFLIGFLAISPMIGFWLSTAWPLSRMGVFIMGMNAGILCVRYARKEKESQRREERRQRRKMKKLRRKNRRKEKRHKERQEENKDEEVQVETKTIDGRLEHHYDSDLNQTDSLLPSQQHPSEAPLVVMPWFHSSGSFIPSEWFLGQCILTLPTDHQTSWKYAVYNQSLSLVLGTLFLMFFNSVGIYLGGNIWFQFFNVFAQLEVIVGLTQLKGNSSASKVLRHPIILWFGELSMSLYLIHWPCIFYACWIYHGSSITYPMSMNCQADYPGNENLEKRHFCQRQLDDWNEARTSQFWFIPILIPIAILLAAGLYYFVEEPIRKYFK